MLGSNPQLIRRQCENFRRLFRRCPGRKLEERVLMDGGGNKGDAPPPDRAGSWAPADSSAESVVGSEGGLPGLIFGDGGLLGRNGLDTDGREDPFSLFPGFGAGLLGRLLSPDGPFALSAPSPPSEPAAPRWRSLLGLGSRPVPPEANRRGAPPSWGEGEEATGKDGEDLATFAERYQRRYGDRNRV